MILRLCFIKRINYWRVIEPIILGSTANILVNYIFKPNAPYFILEEFIFAFVFAIIVTEINHKINISLDKKFSWTQNFSKRFRYHLAYLSLFLLFILNVIGNLYLWILGDGFYTFKEMLVINLSVFIIALFLTILKWAIHFYQNWRKTEYFLKDSTQKLHNLKSEIDKSTQLIELQRGSSFFKINLVDIKYAKIEHGVVWVYFEDTNKAVFQGTLNNLMQLLPEYLFFQLTRNLITHRERIFSISSSTYGKIDVKLKGDVFEQTVIIVSRPKAASFRKWFNSNSS